MEEATFFLSSFKSCPTRHFEPQAKLLEFLSHIHQASANETDDLSPVGKLLIRYGIKDHKIGSRGFECQDLYLPPEQRTLYRISKTNPAGASIQERTHVFVKRAKEIFDYFYPKSASEPDHIVHVTCTGYASPSAPQQLVSERDWETEITHAYHMGCYASLPSIRLALGQAYRKKTIDIVHTEMCSLHMNPSLHLAEQMVVQTLFADGHIHYRLTSQKVGPGFRIIKIKEKILPDTAHHMTWMPASNGMTMSLSREVPGKIEECVMAFTMKLLKEAGLDPDNVFQTGIFAIHPGGSKIVESVSQVLNLSEEQTKASRDILFQRGNMSSSTLPHIWEKILASKPKPGTPVVSLAFGPGLTIFGAVFEYQE